MLIHRFYVLTVAAAIPCLVSFFDGTCSAAILTEKIAVSGDPLPAPYENLVITSVNSRPTINASGEVAFATFSETATSYPSMIWKAGPTSWTLLASEDQSAPGTDTNFYRFGASMEPPILNDAGTVIFEAFLNVSSSLSLGLWSDASGALELITREGLTPQGVAGGGYFFDSADETFSFLTYNNAGQSSFLAKLNGPGIVSSNDVGIWTGSATPGEISLVAREGDAAPGTPTGTLFSALGEPRLDATGRVVFLGQLTGTGITSNNNRGIWVGSSGSLELAARTGNAAPDLDPGIVFSNLRHQTINKAGQIAFRGDITGPGVSLDNNSGIWVGDSTDQDIIARKGDTVPGGAEGLTFSGFGTPSLNGAGRVALYAVVDGAGITPINNTGIWSNYGGVLENIIQEGDHAPGTDLGVTFMAFDIPDNLVMNNAGQIAFRASLTGPGIDASNNAGIWVADPSGRIQLVAREGDVYDANSDPLVEDLRTITLLQMNFGSEDGRPVGFNDAGQVAYYAWFDNDTYNTGAFVAEVFWIDGDLNGDGFVGVDDLTIVLLNWNQTAPPGDPLADSNGDGFVGIDDLTAVLGNWNNSTPPQSSTAIPEPTTLSLLGLAGLISLTSCRSRYRQR